MADLPRLFSGLGSEEKYRVYRGLWDRTERFEVLPSFPLHLDLELSGLCNLRCEHCFQNGMIRKPLGLMEKSLFRRIIEEAVPQGLCGTKMQIRGESLLHPELFDCIAYAKGRGVLDVQLTTNGTLFTPDRIRALMDSGLDAVVISYDEHHDTSIRDKAKPGKHLPVGEAIDLLLERRRASGRPKPMVRVQTTIAEADHASRERVRERLTKRFPLADVFNINRITSMADDEDAYPDLRENYDLLPCSYPFQRMAIFWNGDVTVCCMDYNTRLLLGRYPETPLAELWMSKAMQAFRRAHLAGKRPEMPICRHCHAHLRAKNERLFVHKVESFDYGKKPESQPD